MAIMHPAQLPRTHQPYSEVKFFEACREQLSDKYHVFHSIRWYTTQDGIKENSECDFLIFNPDYGFLCIEVKGGTGIKVEDGNWFIIDNDGERKLNRSPYDQAEQSMRFFKKYYEDESESQFSGVYGFAVAFPNYCLHKPLSVGSSMENTIDMHCMRDLHKKLVELFRYFRGQRKGLLTFLSIDGQRKFVQLINKRIAISISTGSLIEDKERELYEINRVQDIILDLLTYYNRLFIVGGAGTGKTWIGIKKIQRHLYNGGKALYLCYNKSLSEYVNIIFNNESPICYNIDSLAYRILGERALSAPERNGCKEYGDLISDLPKLEKFDLIVVDEAQDFTEDWAYVVNLLLADKGSLFVLYDENQNIYKRNFGEKFFIDTPPYLLRYNIRNTASIYMYTQSHTQLGLDTIANQIEGVEPEYRSFSRKQQAVSYIESIINKLVDKEGVLINKIVILSNRKRENSILHDVDKLGVYTIKGDLPSAQYDYISYRTIHGFKGLESDIVIYLNHTYKNEPRTEAIRALQYTAETRARFILYCIDFFDDQSRISSI